MSPEKRAPASAPSSPSIPPVKRGRGRPPKKLPQTEVASAPASPARGRSPMSLSPSSPNSSVESPVRDEKSPSREASVVPVPATVKELPSNTINSLFDAGLDTALEETVKAVEKAVKGVLNDHVVRWTVPIDKMASIAEELQKKIPEVKVDGYRGMTTDELDEIPEDDMQMNRTIFRQELNNYVMIASSQFSKLSTGTLFSIVRDLAERESSSMIEYEEGAPVKVASTIHKFFDLTEHEFACLDETAQLMMTKKYIAAGLRYHHDMDKFLEEKHRILKENAPQRDEEEEEDPYADWEEGEEEKEKMEKDPFENWPEGRKRQMDLAEAAKRNQERRRLLENELARLNKQEIPDVAPVRALFRARALKGKIGVRSMEEEAKIESQFASTPLATIKYLLGI